VARRKSISLVLARLLAGYFANRVQNAVFIIGCARSGKTLLANCLSRHTDVTHWSEANDIWDPKGYPWHKSKLETPPIECDPVAFTARWRRDTIEKRQKTVRATFGAYQWLSRKRVFLNDSHMNTFRIPQILHIFPQARFIHVLRDGRAVAHDYAEQLRPKMEIWSEAYEKLGLTCSHDELILRLGRFWKAGVEEILYQDQKLKLSQRGVLFELTYEQLCENPALSLQQVLLHLGLDENCLISMTTQLPAGTRGPGRCRKLDKELLSQLEMVLQPTLNRKGYS